jgi:hypothetical protein
MFHDLRRSAARNFERADIQSSVTQRLGGWSDKIYSRHAIGAESEFGAAVGRIGEYIGRPVGTRCTREKNSMKSTKPLAERGPCGDIVSCHAAFEGP